MLGKGWFTLPIFALSSGRYYKSFTVVIYDRNDSTIEIYNCNDGGQYYKTIC